MNTTPYDAIAYNQVRAKASHNSYQRSEGLSDQFAYWRIRSLELDLHNSNNNGNWPALPNNWYVYHSSADSQSTVRTLSVALELLAGFHAAVPDHEVCTVAMDIKDSFDATHTPEQLDSLINAALPGCVYSPSLLLGLNVNLQQCANNWPLLKDMRGKFVFILTTGNIDSSDSHLNQYVENGRTANIRTCFIAPEINRTDQIHAHDYAVWFNMKIGDASLLGPQVLMAGFMSRAYGANGQKDWNIGIESQAHLIGTDKVNSLEDSWASTSNSHGWPFQGIQIAVDPTLVEAGTVIGMDVSSGDIWGNADSCALSPFTTTGGDNTYSFGVSVPGSHAPNSWGKAGLMARTSNADNAANICIVRAAQNNAMRVQVRSKNGDSTKSWDLQSPSDVGVATDTWMYLKLVISGQGHTAQAFGSFDGVVWTEIHSQNFDAPLSLQGIVGSSHDTKKSIRYLYFPVGATQVASSTILIGKDTKAVTFPGVYPS